MIRRAEYDGKADVWAIGVITYILLGGIPGALIDGGSGKGYDYPTLLINGLSCRN